MNYQVKLSTFLSITALALVTLLSFHSVAFAGRSAQNPVNKHVVFAIVGWIYDIDPSLLEAISAVESGGRADATSPKGAQGLMQLMPGTARDFDVRDPYDPIDSAIGAARFIDSLRVQQAADIGAADLPALLAAYNAGEGAVRRYHGIPPYRETRDYVRKVLWLYLMGSPSPRSTIASAPSRSTSRTEYRKSFPARVATDSDLLERLSSIRRARDAAQEKEQVYNRRSR